MNKHTAPARFSKRYKLVSQEKAGGATYTPSILADFVAQQIVEATTGEKPRPLRVLDPAAGDGALLVSLVQKLGPQARLEVHAFDVEGGALAIARQRLLTVNKHLKFVAHHKDFLVHVLEKFQSPTLFSETNKSTELYDLIIANPPYVRTQIMGANVARSLADQFQLTGRVDLYHAFLVAMSRVLAPHGIAGVIVSNRFMTTRSGASVRAAIRETFALRHAWDLGDTKLFDAAVLPAVLLMEGKNKTPPLNPPRFTSIYETSSERQHVCKDPISALAHEGVVGLEDGRHFEVRHGVLTAKNNDVWRVSNQKSDEWLQTVSENTWRVFGDVGKIRVGVKTCADKVFIRSDWSGMENAPELLRPLTTHHIARRFRACNTEASILYPHEVVDGNRRAVCLKSYPRSFAYLKQHRHVLESRRYVIDAGRQWYEIWVPQDPNAWQKRKLVFRDISEVPMFWIDEDASIVNGDCYWMTADNEKENDLLWLAAAIANSTFAEKFYDRKFNNKLYAGRRRYITQYVEQFPLPNPETKIAREIAANAKAIYEQVDTPSAAKLEEKTDALVWRAFGLVQEEVAR